MRTFGHLLLMLLVVVLLWMGGRAVLRLLPERGGSGLPGGELFTVYSLPGDGWLTFPIPPSGTLLKVISNALLPPAGDVRSPDSFPYALDYRFLDAEGRVLRTKRYHHRTREITIRKGDAPPLVLSPPDEKPLPGRVFLLNLRDVPSAHRLQLRFAGAAPPLRGGIVRVYSLDRVSDRKLGYLWDRLSKGERERVTRNALFPAELLDQEQLRTLLAQSWHPLGPQGVSGRDFTAARLYQRGDVDEYRPDSDIPPPGLLLSPGRRGTVPLPESSRIRLRFIAADSGGALPSPLGVRFTHYGSSSQGRSWSVSLPPDLPLWEGDLQGGLLEIEADAPVVVRAFRLLAGREEEITPAPLFVRGYLLGEGKPLLYQIAHASGEATPLRLDLRALIPDGKGGPTLAVHYALLDGGGRTVREGTLDLHATPSPYDRPAEGEGFLSEPARYHFLVPPGISALRLDSASAVVASAYSRPPDLLPETRVPEDYTEIVRSRERQPLWFPFNPPDQHDLVEKGRSMALAVQHRPPDPQEAIPAGSIDLWEDVHPEGKWLGRHLLTPVPPGDPPREQTLGVTFVPLRPGRDAVLEFADRLALPAVAPSFLYLRRSEEPVPFTLYVDDLPHHTGFAVGRRGELQLPPLPAGRRRVRLETAGDGKFLISHVRPSGGALRKRLVNRIAPQGLTFRHRKGEGAELLTFRLHVPEGRRERFRLRVVLEPRPRASAPAGVSTLTERRYDILPLSGPSVPVLGTAEGTADGGRLFFFPLGEDVPAGEYRIRIAPEGKGEGYLALTRRVPGRFAERFFRKESTLVDYESFD